MQQMVKWERMGPNLRMSRWFLTFSLLKFGIKRDMIIAYCDMR